MTSPIALLNSLVYLDRGYISDLYEITTGKSPKTTITSTQGGKAGAGISFFSAEVSAQETRSFPVSTMRMLSETLDGLEREPKLRPADFQPGMRSQHGWVEGDLTVFLAASKVQRGAVMETIATPSHFQLLQKPDVDLALITAPDYFAHGLDTLQKMQETLLEQLSIPVRALVKVIAARSYHTKQWVAIPLVMLERDADL